METAFICCTIRTEELFNRFKSGMEKKYRIVEHELEQKNIWYYFKYARIVLLERGAFLFVLNRAVPSSVSLDNRRSLSVSFAIPFLSSFPPELQCLLKR